MASKVITTRVCDGCDKEEDPKAMDVQTYTVKVGAKTRTFEACRKCLPPSMIMPLVEAGRKG